MVFHFADSMPAQVMQLLFFGVQPALVLFPAFRDLIPAQEFLALGDMFEKVEHQVLGSEGFGGQVHIVEKLEKKLGIFDLAQFTPN